MKGWEIALSIGGAFFILAGISLFFTTIGKFLGPFLLAFGLAAVGYIILKKTVFKNGKTKINN